MPLLSKTLTLPLLVSVLIPTFFLAYFTTCFALSILLFRCVLIYIDLFLAIIPHYFFGGASKVFSQAMSIDSDSISPTLPISIRRRKRRNSSCSTLSVTGSMTPLGLPTPGSSDNHAVISSNSSALGLNTSVGPTRDFEGVGGWKLDGQSDEDEALWTKINSRLELPADNGRRHKRSLTGDGRGREVSMNCGRARTPPTALSTEREEKGLLMKGSEKKKGTGSSGNSPKSPGPDLG